MKASKIDTRTAHHEKNMTTGLHNYIPRTLSLIIMERDRCADAIMMFIYAYQDEQICSEFFDVKLPSG